MTKIPCLLLHSQGYVAFCFCISEVVPNNDTNNNRTVAKIGMQFIAANVLELHWGVDTLMTKDGLNLRNVTNIDVGVEDYGNGSILFAILVDGNCNTSVVLNHCFFKMLEVWLLFSS